MEKITVQVSSGESSPRVHAWVDADEETIGSFHGWLMRNDVLEIGEIATCEAHRRRGVASRLVLYAAHVLRVRQVNAGVSSTEGEGFFESLKRRDDIEVDYYF
ncbi:GNAT family N-acetyltransferase [Microbacterium sp. p3-SID338]|uniref:GNAT family N-acetyltransferase n=1 Tax=Microbacterium sp. p3-SID338 TaxID=2916214 RepID=UPI0021A378E0|nr:GNAT family N-acetyltransferase [Microbacterium sp. p3-SID338]MCT1395661.1 GNAT family N-acetyltransferase [Microbacterium sp. p3-SID338]